MAPLIPVALEIARIAAPGLIKWISGSESAAEAAGDLVAIAQEVTATGHPEAALERLRADGAARLQLHQRSLELEHDLEKAYLIDRQNARAAAVELAKSGEKSGQDRKNFMVRLDVMGLLAGLAGMMALGYIKATYPDSVSEGVFGALLAQLSTITSYFGLCLRDAHQFEFGSSRGSEQKTDLIAKSPAIKTG